MSGWLDRIRSSGKIAPSLLSTNDSDVETDGSFETAVLKVQDADSFTVATGQNVATDFDEVMKMASSVDNALGTDEKTKIANLVARRSIILALVGSTPSGSDSVDQILANGYCDYLKVWLNDTVTGKVGGVDLLLHLLSNITDLPVTKSIVKDSGMGKLIGTLSKKFAGTPNESAIKSRVDAIMEAWKKSVKVKKETKVTSSAANSSSSKDNAVDCQQASKRPLPSNDGQHSKKVKTVASSNGSKSSNTLSNLLQKVAPGTSSSSKKKRSVKWADHFGDNLSKVKVIGSTSGDDDAAAELHSEPTSGFLDSKKRDREREKALLAKVKKAKLLDDDDDDIDSTPMERKPAAVPSSIQPTVAWRQPSLITLPNPPPDVNSKEKLAQDARMTSVAEAIYKNDYVVPNSPAPMSDVEQALDMTSQSSTVTETIPFFVPQAPAPASTPAPAPAVAPATSTMPATSQIPVQPSPPRLASAMMVQNLGLPSFLAGSSVSALEQLASQPSLLSTFVGANGMYDEQRLIAFVRTMSGDTAAAPAQTANTGYGAYGTSSGNSAYGSNANSGGSYGQGSTYGNSYGGASGTRSDNRGSGTEANLHLSGYGPSTTREEILALFSPYVNVSEVVMKANFSFVNTRDPEGAQRARDQLTGTLLGGMPVRINTATRKNTNTSQPSSGGMGNSSGSSFYGQQTQNQSSFGQNQMAGNNPYGQQQPPPMPPQPGQMNPNRDLSQVRDDRGNAATKNLFVAGYGEGTHEGQIRQLFSAFGSLVSVMMKPRFTFVNTTDRAIAVAAREALMGYDVNGGRLRINFAKESGRLGTSFDLGYGTSGNPPIPQNMQRNMMGSSYYGR